MAAPTSTQTCYRHPGRETRVQCSNCARPICPDCMTPTPVGMRCPECAKDKTPVRTLASARQATAPLTMGIIVVCALIAVASGSLTGVDQGNRLYQEGVLFGPFVDLGNEWYRLVTYGFLHSGILHILFNMYLLYLLGNELETDLGSPRFALLYLAGLLGGAAGALFVDPQAPTVGASGAVFGLMGFAFFTMRARGFDPMQSGIGPLILLNLVISFVIPNVSWGGHVGGLVAGSLCALAYEQVRHRKAALGFGALGGVAVLAGAAAVVAALGSV